MTFDAEYPFDGYKAYLRTCNSSKSKGRKIIGLYSSEKIPVRLTMSYARYLICVKEKRILNKNEQVDHDDGDKTNDLLSNLNILSVGGNNRKRVNETGTNLMMVELNCPCCKINFIKKKSDTFISKGGFYSTCSKECCIKMLSIKKGLSEQELKLIGEKQIIRIFRSQLHKNII